MSHLHEPQPELPPSGPAERRRAVLLFLATLLCVYLVHGYQWTNGDPLTDADTARDSALFAGALMSILLAHEMGHYLVARRHGFELSLPYFLPFPAAFGTFGAIIRLRSLPRTRTALLEMGAAGPIAGLAVAVTVMALGMGGTVEHGTLELPIEAEPTTSVFGWLLYPLLFALDWLLSHTPVAEALPPVTPGVIPVMILNNPPVMDLLGEWMLGQAPSRYANLGPLSLAGWVGCLLTAINLVPIGQLDGGHVANAVSPRWAPRLARLCILAAFLGASLWVGWAFWGVLLLVMGAWISLPVPEQPGLSRRARVVACVAAAGFALTFMPQPVELENMPIWQAELTLPAEHACNPSGVAPLQEGERAPCTAG